AAGRRRTSGRQRVLLLDLEAEEHLRYAEAHRLRVACDRPSRTRMHLARERLAGVERDAQIDLLARDGAGRGLCTHGAVLGYTIGEEVAEARKALLPRPLE